MRGERTYRVRFAKCLGALGGLICLTSSAWGQISISSIQSSLVGANSPNNVQGITSGAQLPGNGFTLWINGSFLDVGTNVQWFNPSTGVTFSGSTSPNAGLNQVQLFVPENLYLTPVASTQTVQVTVTQGIFQATGQFFVNAPLVIAASMPLATVGTAYSAPVVNGGTPPYTLQQVVGALPNGLSITGNQFLSGIPTAQGIFNFTPRIDDQWVSAQKGLQVQVIAPATISSVGPNAAAAGSGLLQMSITGTNFVDPQSPAGGSVVQWKFNNVTTSLFTAYNSATSLTATVPTQLMAAPGLASVTVAQPDGTFSPAQPFTLVAPSLSSLSPPTTPAGVGLTLTLNGANFADRTAAIDAVGIKVPQVQFGSTLLQGSFLNSGAVAVVIPANLVGTQGPINVVEINPGGSTTGTLVFTVTAPPTVSAQPISLIFNAIAGGSNPPAQQLLVSGNLPALTFTATPSVLTPVSGAWLGVSPQSGATPANVAVSINTTGLTRGTYNGSVVVAGSGGATGSTTVPVSLTLVAPPTITPLNPPLATTGKPYSTTATATGGIGAYAWSANGLPPGLGISPQTGAITGTPQISGSFPVQVSVTDAGNNTAQATFIITVISPAILSSITPNTVPAGSGLLQIIINGANFVDPQSPFGGSIAQFKFGSANAVSTATTFISATQLRATLPTALMAVAGVAGVTVLQPDGVSSSGLPFSLVAPSIGSISPSTILSAGAGFTLTVNGANFTDTSAAPDAVGIKVPQVRFGGSLLTATFVNSTTLTVAIPANAANSPGLISVVEINPGGATSNSVTFTVTSTLAIISQGLSSGTSGTPYSSRVTAIGGFGAYTWSAAGLPPGLAINPQTGDIAGTPQSQGTFQVSVRVTDAQGTGVTAAFTITIGLPPPTISTPPTLSSGTVGISYQATIGVGGGGGPFTFAVTGGALPDGLSLTQNGLIFGTPSKAGTFTFTITATDPNGNAPSKGFTITIAPAALTVPGGGTTTGAAGTPLTINLTPTGGVAPYRYTVNCTLPAGLTFSNGVISGTPTTPGTYTCRIVISDAAGTVVTKDITITVASPELTFQGSTLAAGQVGVIYTAAVAATGGTAPITYAGSGVPDGLNLAGNGAISGTPGTEGSFSFSVTATDATGTKATASFSITIAPAKVAVTTASLPDGVVGANYSASLAASGGARPYTWTVSGLPGGVSGSAAGAISGTPDAAGRFSVTATVKDNAGATATATFTVTIAAAPLVITTASVAGGTVGTAYTASFTASGGVTPLTWSATGLPNGLSISATGAISGTPTAPGTSNVTITVRDSAGTSISRSFTIAVALPATPPLNFGGVADTLNPLQQPRLTVSLGTTFPVDVVVTLTITFAPDTGADDPAILFSIGGRTARITVPAGSSSGSADVGVQTGTVAGLITIAAQLQAAGLDVTPAPAPRRTIRVSPAAPVISTATGTRTGTGFTVTVNGFVTNREITQAIFTFNPAAGSNLQTTSLTVAAEALFSSYFGGTGAAPFGSQFTFTQPFTVNGTQQAIASVTVTLVNRIGNSAAVTVNLN